MNNKPVPTEDVLDDLGKLLRDAVPPNLEPHHITLVRIIKRGISPNVAARMLAEWIADKKVRPLGKRRAQNGTIVEAWEVVK